MKKLLNNKGESLVESLVAILIFTLSSILLYTMLSTATNLNRAAKEADEAHQQQMIYAEQAESLIGSANPDLPSGVNGSGKVKFTLTDQSVDLFSDNVKLYRLDPDSLYSYALD